MHDSKDRAYASHRALMKDGVRKNDDFLQLWFK